MVDYFPEVIAHNQNHFSRADYERITTILYISKDSEE